MAENSLDLDSIEHLDFTYEPPCESSKGKIDDPLTMIPNCPTGKPAEWRVTSNHCGTIHIKLWCDTCLNRKRERPLLICSICGEQDTPKNMWVSIERIGS